MLPPPPPLLPPPAALPPPLLLAPPTCHPPGPLTCVGGSGGVVVAPCAERPPLLVWRPPLDASLPPLLVELCCRLPRRLCCGWVLPDADPLAWCPWPFLPRREAFCCSDKQRPTKTRRQRVSSPRHTSRASIPCGVGYVATTMHQRECSQPRQTTARCEKTARTRSLMEMRKQLHGSKRHVRSQVHVWVEWVVVADQEGVRVVL